MALHLSLGWRQLQTGSQWQSLVAKQVGCCNGRIKCHLALPWGTSMAPGCAKPGGTYSEITSLLLLATQCFV